MSARKESQILSAIFWVVVASGVGIYAYMDHKKTETKKLAKEEAKRLFKLDVELPKHEHKGGFKIFGKKHKGHKHKKGKKGKKDKHDHKAMRKKLIQQGITEVTIHNGNAKKGKQTITMVRQGPIWMLTQPVKTPGDLTNIKTILSEIADAKRTRVVREIKGDKDKTFKRYGLDTPKHSISFRFRKLTHTVLIGNKDKYTNDYYAYVKGSKQIVLVGSSLYYAADKKLYALRRKDMFTQNTKNIELITIKRPQGELVFKRHGGTVHYKGDGHKHHGHGHNHGKRKKSITKEWLMLKPKQAKTNATKVNGLLSTLKGMRAEEFLSEDVSKDAAKFGLDKPEVTVTVTFKNKKTLTLRLSRQNVKGKKKKKRKHYAAASSGPIARVSQHIIKALSEKAFEFRRQRVVQFKYDRARVVQVTPGEGKPFKLMRIDGKSESWRVIAPSPRSAEKSKVTSLLNGLRDLKTLKFVKEHLDAKELATYGLDKPILTYQIYGGSSKKELAALYVGKKNKAGNYFATNREKEKLFEVKAIRISKLGKAPWQFIPKGKPPKRPKAPTQSLPKKTPAKRPAAPTKRPAAPVKRPVAPTKRPVAPAPRRAAAPVKRPAAPAPRRAAAPTKPAAPAPRRAAAPAPRRAAPAKRAEPAKRAAAPAKRAEPRKAAPARRAPARRPASRPAK